MELKDFELVEKRYARNLLEGNKISIGKNSISLSKDIAKRLMPYVLIYLNRKDNLIGLAKTQDNIRGFKMSVNKNNYHFQAREFIEKLKKGVYDCKIDGKFVVIKGALKKEDKNE